MNDLISRQEAIRLAEQGQIQGFEWQFKKLCTLPSAEPEIIRCKDCKYCHREIHDGIEYFNFSSCNLSHNGDGHDFYCADAERRTDEA